tara:strand:+ start:99 stop:836 length:738 start_codon:yes stop_codon:yes gene_type:complete
VLCNFPTPIRSPAFEGEALLRVRGAPGAPVPGGGEQLEEVARHLAGRRRHLWATVRGRFTERVPVSDVIAGHEFSRAVRVPRHSALIIALLRRIMPAMEINVGGQKPYLHAPLVTEAKAIRVRRPREGAELAAAEGRAWAPDDLEDNALLGGWFAEGRRSAGERRRHFCRPGNMEGLFFEPDLEYEFDMYQHQVDMTKYDLLLPGLRLDLARILDGQPAQTMAKLVSRDEPLWDFSFWCDRLVQV